MCDRHSAAVDVVCKLYERSTTTVNLSLANTVTETHRRPRGIARQSYQVTYCSDSHRTLLATVQST